MLVAKLFNHIRYFHVLFQVSLLKKLLKISGIYYNLFTWFSKDIFKKNI